jgi:transcriptional regulator GlxA family with amidase domain
LVDAFPDVTPVADRLFVVDGPRITCAGGVGAVDLAAWLVDRHLGQAPAAKALHILIADRARPADAPQPHVAPGSAVSDPRLRRAIRLMQDRLADPPRIDALAAQLDLSRRQLERIFLDETGQSPSAYCRQLRLTQGRWLLSETDRSVTDIALACGFADASHFARATKAAFGVTPEGLRAIARQGQGQAIPTTTAPAALFGAH